jgi:hypothetical protein
MKHAARSLWASVNNDPQFMRRVNGFLTLFWIAMIPISLWLGWLSSVSYVSALSLWALVAGHWSTWQAARVEEVQQADDAKAEAYPVEERVVDAVLRQTDVNRNPDAPDPAAPLWFRCDSTVQASHSWIPPA